MKQGRWRAAILPSLLAAATALLATGPVTASIAISCPFGGNAGEMSTRGIVVPDYPGTNVRSVQLNYNANIPGNYIITLQIRRGTFDGPTVGAVQTAVVGLSGIVGLTIPVVFDFGGAPVSPGDTLTLIQTASGPGDVFFDGGMSGVVGDPALPVQGNDEAYETTDTSPPMSTYLRNRVGITINQDQLTSGCIPSDTVLCLDDSPGDRRFQVNVAFSTAEGGGLSGNGQAISLKSLGDGHSGLFWFFTPDNKEMLIKVLNSCSGPGKSYWVFFSAGTNVGFTVTVLDTATNHSKTYSNQDLHGALPVQDTSAFPCQ